MTDQTSYQVLFLEDEPTICEVLTEYMTLSGYQVTSVPNGDEAISLINSRRYDIAVLDIMLPGTDGFGVLAKIRECQPEMAVIMLTALDDEKTQIRAFNHYADDYVIKPVSPIILLKRMETILRRTALSSAAVKASDSGLTLDSEAYRALYNGQRLPLTLSEYLLLQTLYRHPGRVYTRELPIPCIKTVIGVGYQFDQTLL